jgi:PHD/YefM family antitoxin component YafN of YafNO toxin-antitoxin module
MRIASIADIKAKFSGYLKMSERGPIVVTRNGKPKSIAHEDFSREVESEMSEAG